MKKYHEWFSGLLTRAIEQKEVTILSDDRSFIDFIGFADDTFFTPRQPDVGTISRIHPHLDAFQTFLMIDCPIEGYRSNTKDRHSLLSYFMNDQKKSLSKAEIHVGEQLCVANMRFLKVERIDRENNILTLSDIQSKHILDVRDSAGAKSLSGGDLLLARILMLDDKNVFAGIPLLASDKSDFRRVAKLGTLLFNELSKESPGMYKNKDEFLLWNGYISYRELFDEEPYGRFASNTSYPSPYM